MFAGLRESVPIVIQQYLKWLANKIKVNIRQIIAAGFNVSNFIWVCFICLNAPLLKIVWQPWWLRYLYVHYLAVSFIDSHFTNLIEFYNFIHFIDFRCWKIGFETCLVFTKNLYSFLYFIIFWRHLFVTLILLIFFCKSWENRIFCEINWKFMSV